MSEYVGNLKSVRKNQIFDLHNPNNPLRYLLQEMMARNAKHFKLHFDKYRNIRNSPTPQKKYNNIFIHTIGLNFEQFQRLSTSLQKNSSWLHFRHIVRRLLKHQDCMKILSKIYFKTYSLASVTYPFFISSFECEITHKFSRQKSTLVCYKYKNQLYCMKERLLQLKEIKFQLYKLKRWRISLVSISLYLSYAKNS